VDHELQVFHPTGVSSFNEEAKSGPDAKNQNGDFIGGV
jgi:hypothetical protein